MQECEVRRHFVTSSNQGILSTPSSPPFDIPHFLSPASNRSGPVYSQSFMASDPATGGASLATCLEVGAVSQDSDTGAHLLPGFAVGYDDGRVDFLAFGDNYVTQVGWLVGRLVGW